MHIEAMRSNQDDHNKDDLHTYLTPCLEIALYHLRTIFLELYRVVAYGTTSSRACFFSKQMAPSLHKPISTLLKVLQNVFEMFAKYSFNKILLPW